MHVAAEAPTSATIGVGSRCGPRDHAALPALLQRSLHWPITSGIQRVRGVGDDGIECGTGLFVKLKKKKFSCGRPMSSDGSGTARSSQGMAFLRDPTLKARHLAFSWPSRRGRRRREIGKEPQRIPVRARIAKIARRIGYGQSYW